MTFATVNGTQYNSLQDLQKAWDEQAYLAANSDVAGLYSSGSSYMTPGTEDYAWANAYGAPGLTHYLTAGMNEGRGGTFLDPTQKQTYQYATIGPNDPNYSNYQQALAYNNGQLVLNSRDANGDAHLTANPTEATPLWQQGSTAAIIDNKGGLAGGGANSLDKTSALNAWISYINNWNSYANNTPGVEALGGVKMSDLLASQNLANQAAGVDPLAASTSLSALTGQAQTLGGYQAYGGNFDHYGEGPEHDFFGDQFIDLPALKQAAGLPNATTDQNLANYATAQTLNAGGANPGAITAGAISNNISGALAGATGAVGGGLDLMGYGGASGVGGYLIDGVTPWAGDVGSSIGTVGGLVTGNPFLGLLGKGIGNAYSVYNANQQMTNAGAEPTLGFGDWLNSMLPEFLGGGGPSIGAAQAEGIMSQGLAGSWDMNGLQSAQAPYVPSSEGVTLQTINSPNYVAPVPEPIVVAPAPAPLPSNYGGGGGCFITTAICDYLGKPDDCDELQTMRWLRDNVLAKSEKGRADIEDYYATAPGIVASLGDSPEVYSVLREQYLTPCIEATKAGEHDKAWSIYLDMVEEAKRAAQ